MNRTEKAEVIDSLQEVFADSNAVILLDFQKVNVPDITELRRKVRETKGGYEVVKNTLALRAASGGAVEQLKDHFRGPTAIAYTAADPVALAKVLKEVVKSHPGLSFKAGVLEGKLISDAEVEGLADLPGREQLLSKVLFLLNAPLTRLASALQSPVRDLAYVLSQLAEKKQQ